MFIYTLLFAAILLYILLFVFKIIFVISRSEVRLLSSAVVESKSYNHLINSQKNFDLSPFRVRTNYELKLTKDVNQ